MRRKNIDDGTNVAGFRQVMIGGLNESITLISNFEGEDMRYLSDRALKMYNKVKSPKE